MTVEFAWTPRPLVYVWPLMVIVRPSPVPLEPLLVFFSTGPQPLTGVLAYGRSLTYVIASCLYVAVYVVSLVGTVMLWLAAPLSDQETNSYVMLPLLTVVGAS